MTDKTVTTRERIPPQKGLHPSPIEVASSLPPRPPLPSETQT